MATAQEIEGLEFDWLASDADGHVALFSTAGAGYAPDAFLSDLDSHELAIASILALPASTRASFAPSLAPGLDNTWQKMAERGVFAFDADPNGGPYRLVAAPEKAALRSALPVAVHQVARRLEYPGLRFCQSLVLDGVALRRDG